MISHMGTRAHPLYTHGKHSRTPTPIHLYLPPHTPQHSHTSGKHVSILYTRVPTQSRLCTNTTPTHVCVHVNTIAMCTRTYVHSGLMCTPTCMHTPGHLCLHTCVHTQSVYQILTHVPHPAPHPACAHAKHMHVHTHSHSDPPTLHWLAQCTQTRCTHSLSWDSVHGAQEWVLGCWTDRLSHLSCLPAWACVCAAVPSPPRVGRGQEEQHGGGGRPQWP